MLADVPLVHRHLAFLGLRALLPLTEAALAIAAGHRNGAVHDLLTYRALVWLGNHAEYLYLCHWPLVVLFEGQEILLPRCGLGNGKRAPSYGVGSEGAGAGHLYSFCA